jgi:hypothetical protein
MNTPPTLCRCAGRCPPRGLGQPWGGPAAGPAHPRRASRDPLQGAALAVRQSRPGGALGWAASLFDAVVFLLNVYFIRLPKGSPR